MRHLYKLIKSDEGIRLHAYNDKDGERVRDLPDGGKVTIGYGYNLSNNPIPIKVAEMLLQHSVAIAIEDAISYAGQDVWDGLSGVRKSVLVSMAYNMGLTSLRKFRRVRAALERKDYRTASAEILDSSAARQLRSRYLRLANMMHLDEWPNGYEIH